MIHRTLRNKDGPQARTKQVESMIKRMCADGNAVAWETLTLCSRLPPLSVAFSNVFQLVHQASLRRMPGVVNAPSVHSSALAMTRLPPSATATKASTELSKTPPPWLVQVSRFLF